MHAFAYYELALFDQRIYNWIWQYPLANLSFEKPENTPQFIFRCKRMSCNTLDNF